MNVCVCMCIRCVTKTCTHRRFGATIVRSVFMQMLARWRMHPSYSSSSSSMLAFLLMLMHMHGRSVQLGPETHTRRVNNTAPTHRDGNDARRTELTRSLTHDSSQMCADGLLRQTNYAIARPVRTDCAARETSDPRAA